MPKTYEIKTQRTTVFDGQIIEENETVGVLITDQPLGNVLSGAAFGTLRVEEIDPAAAPLRVTARAEEKTPPIPATEAAATNADDDPDALNAEDAAADAAEAAAEAAADAATKAAAKAAADVAKPEEQPLPAEFEGLNVRIARALVRQGLVSKQAIRDYVADGGDLVDLEEIGTAAVVKINAWLET